MSLRRPNGFISAGYDPLEVPNAPTIGTASIASATAVSVTFTAPSNVGGSAITGYVATAKKTSDGTTISGTGSSSPVTISGLSGDIATAYTVTVAAVNSFGLGVSSAAVAPVLPQQLWSWGRNDYGQLGIGANPDRSSPVQVGALTTWAEVSGGGGFTAAVTTSGTLFSWGNGGDGRLGQGESSISRSSPVQVGALADWAKVHTGQAFCAAIKTNSTIWSWGSNYNGQLGRNSNNGSSTLAQRASPVQIGSLTNWARVSVGARFCMAVKTDGTMWSWGRNTYGELSQNDTDDRSSPVQVGSLTTWSKTAAGYNHCLAIRTNGTLWSWGRNLSGQLGHNNNIERSSPVQIGALTTWAEIAAGDNFSLAITTSGTLFAWGGSSAGQTGINTNQNASSPVQVGALTGWSQVSAGSEFGIARKTDGSIWSWGNQQFGRLGQGVDSGTSSSPVQIGSLTTWSKISAGNYFALAIKSP